jgi:type I restriction enzyme, S subunit
LDLNSRAEHREESRGLKQITEEGWVLVRLGEVANLLTGFPFKSDYYVENEDAPRLLRGDNVAQGFLRWEGVKRWPPNAVKDVADYWLNEGDIILAMDRPWIEAGLKYASVRLTDLPSLLVQRVARLRGTQRLDNRFLKYVIASKPFTDHVLAVQTGTAVPHISGDQIKSFEFLLPPLSKQGAIADVLGGLDDKIELNQQMNRTLEAIGKAMFRHWFVDFEFPNEEGKPYKSTGGVMAYNQELEKQIPVGWQIGSFGKLIGLTMGLSPKGESYNSQGEGVPLINGAADFSDGRIVPKKFTTQPTRICNSGDLLLCIRGTIGNLTYADRPYCLGRGVAAIVTRDTSYKEYVYFVLEQKISLMTSQATGSVIVGLSIPDIVNLRVLLPREPVVRRFHEVAESIFARKEMSNIEADKLSEIRDYLLPKLMSGKIRVPVEAG